MVAGFKEPSSGLKPCSWVQASISRLAATVITALTAGTRSATSTASTPPPE
jgi:hypothetical protein